MREQHLTEAGDAQATAYSSGSRLSVVEIEPMEIARDIWHAKYMLAVSLMAAIALALLSVTFGQKSYTAEAVLGPAESSAQQGLNSSIGQLAGAASLFGVNVGTSGGTDFVKFKTLLTSERVADVLFQDDSLKAVFFGPGWVSETRSWKRPTGLAFYIKDFLKGLLGLPRWKVPGPYTLQDDLMLHLGILNDKVTGYIKVSIQRESPSEANYVLSKIIMAADGLIRRDVRSRTAGRIAYLKDVLQQTSLQDQREAIIAVLSAQEKTMMMTSADKTFAIDVIDPPSTNPLPTSPKPREVLTTSALLAILLVSLWAGLRGHFFVRSRGASTGAAKKEPSLDVAIREWLEACWRNLSSPTSRRSILRRAVGVFSRH